MRGSIGVYGALRHAGLTAAIFLGLVTAAIAEPPPRQWDLGMGIYGWVPAADLKVGGRDRVTGDRFSRNFHKDLGDAFEDWDGGGGGYLDFRYARFVALLDAVWVQSDYNSDGYQTSTLVDAKVGFRVLDTERPFSQATANDAPRLYADLLVGARFHDHNANVDDTPDGSLSYDQHRDWWNPVVGMRWSADLTRNLSLGLVGDVGGFDIGNASSLTWSVQPRLNYRAWEHLDLFVGWRHLYDDRDREREVGLSGPQAGLGYRF
jgi:hypothetical protein